MCLHDFIHAIPAMLSLQQESGDTAATPFPNATEVHGENFRVPATGEI
ncbi:hypothetical protein [Methanoregula sp.]|jgi:hypothetical protein